MTETQIEILVVIVAYALAGIFVWKTWPAFKEVPDFLVSRFHEWARRVTLESEERTFLRSYAKAKTEAERKRLLVSRLRVHLFALGCDVSSFTDEEIEHANVRFMTAIASTGLTLEEASRNIATSLAGGDPRRKGPDYE